METRTLKVRPRARRSRYRFTFRFERVRRSTFGVGLLILALIGATLFVTRISSFLSAVTNNGNPFAPVVDVFNAPAGSVAWKIQHGQTVNLVLLGYGGAENDAPYLTDTIMVVQLDGARHRIVEASVPRDLWVTIDAWPSGSPNTHDGKVNEAYLTGIGDDPTKLSQFQGRDGGGHLAEHVLSRVTGLQFDGYVGVDFVAFRDVVNALGGIPVHMSAPLDDCHYPDYHNGYMNGGVPEFQACPNATAGIHFKAGDYQVNGEQALELARSRHAEQPEQATDFGRAKRQQMIMTAIKHKVLSINGLLKVLPLMSALQKNVRTDVTAGDVSEIYRWGGGIPDSQVEHVALTDQDLLGAYFQSQGSCGPYDAYVLCPQDQSYGMLHRYFSNLDPGDPALKERVPVAIANASYNSEDLGDRVVRILQPLGLIVDPVSVRHPSCPKSYILDASGGKGSATAAWLGGFFQAPVVTSPQAYQGYPGCIQPAAGQPAAGIVVVLGRDFALRWYGLQTNP